MLLVLQEDKLCKISFAFYLLPVAGVLSKMFSTQPCWFRWQSLRKTTWSHSNQPGCTFDLRHSRAGTKWAPVCFLFNSMLSAECEVSLSLHPELHQIALISQKTHRHALTLLNRTLALTCFFRFLSFLYPHVGIEWKETLELIFSNFQFFNFQVIRTWPQ